MYFNPFINIDDLDEIQKLFENRYNFIKYDLAYNMSKSEDIFDTWMMNESDNIQNLSKTYAEYQVVKQFNQQIKIVMILI